MVYVKRWVGKTEPGGVVSPGIIYCLPVRLVSRAVRVAERGFGRCVVVCVCVFPSRALARLLFSTYNHLYFKNVLPIDYIDVYQ